MSELNARFASPGRQARRPGFRKLPPSAATFVMPLILSILMTCVVSAVATLRNIGLVEGVAGHWLQAWGLSWLIAFPTLLLVLPLVRRIVGLLVQSPAR
ncbi:DUF2798 domain-containing protein [Niveispirillum sp. BGYR6]|uniref:DUF2798 domain-containing protein n=1 Tax=Niveispirillum sp. BGYR6 TaxID=2971249 RepID=UPI0022B956AF|nr:DUF2798 domain-containing protein [Niveispirillum sp. BGYR6]MDG5497741.1 DUF2798 domain-containing protein [Niveispirillum sp. BGYR6]